MPFDPRNHRAEGAFVEDAPPGIQVASVGPAQRVAMQKTNAERVYAGLARTWKITNRAQHGSLKDKPWVGFGFNSVWYPDAVDVDDEGTWLQPGDSIVVDREAAIHAVGDIFSPLAPDKQEIILKYGGMEYDVQPTQDGKVAGRVPVMTILGPPVEMPDLVVQQIDQRGRETGPAVSLLEAYGLIGRSAPKYAKPQMDGKSRRKDLITV